TSTISRNLVVTTNGALTQSGALVVTGTTALAAGAGNNITLSNPGNNFTGAVSVATANNVTLRDTNALVLGTSTASGDFNVVAGGAIQDGDGTAINITGTTVSLTAGTGVGTVADPLEINVSTLNSTSGSGGIFVSEIDAMTLGTILTSAGNVAISNGAGDITINSVTATTGGVDVTSAGSILSGGAGPHLTAGASSTLQALNGVVGTVAAPINAAINPGTLSIRATGAVSGVSGFLTGTVLPSNQLTLLNVPPGLVCINGWPIVANPFSTVGLLGAGTFVYLNRDAVIPNYYGEPSGATVLTNVSAMYVPDSVVAASATTISGDSAVSVARAVPPCTPALSCLPHRDVSASPSDAENPAAR
ncbi:MAG: hypothetical protein ACT4OO_06335, partial [Nitrospiraceae bacterium]